MQETKKQKQGRPWLGKESDSCSRTQCLWRLCLLVSDLECGDHGQIRFTYIFVPRENHPHSHCKITHFLHCSSIRKKKKTSQDLRPERKERILAGRPNCLGAQDPSPSELELLVCKAPHRPRAGGPAGGRRAFPEQPPPTQTSHPFHGHPRYRRGNYRPKYAPLCSWRTWSVTWDRRFQSMM